MSFAETAELTFCSRTAKEISGSEVRDGLGRIRDSAFVTYSSVSDRRFEHNGPVYVDPRAAPGWLPLKVGCMFSRMDAFNPLHRYHQMRSSIPSVDGQMRCGSDVNAGD
jgi:hypothetical protein